MRRGFITALAVVLAAVMATFQMAAGATSQAAVGATFQVAQSVLTVATQSPGLRFDVASIKPQADDASGGGGMCAGPDTQVRVTRFGPGGLSTQNAPAPVSPCTCRFRGTTVRTLIATAYGVTRAAFGLPVVGGPSWIDSERFDVDAKAEQVRPHAEVLQMLQQLLVERFGLRTHRETRDVDGFALTVAPGGPRLALSTSFAGGTVSWAGSITTQGAMLDRLTQALEFPLAKPIVNQTGLTGVYAFTLRWTPGDDERPVMPGAPPEVQERINREIDRNGPSLFTALDEQLGLRLQPRTVPHEYLVIDAVERPTAN